MAKRGERRPWRVQFEWTTGGKGTETYRTEQDAQAAADLIRAAGQRWADQDVTVTVTKRED